MRRRRPLPPGFFSGALSHMRYALAEDSRDRNTIADAAGISESLMSEFMAGKKGLSLDALGRLAEATGRHVALMRAGRKSGWVHPDDGLENTLRRMVNEVNESHRGTAKAAGIAASQFSEFMKGTKGLSVESAERLTGVLGYKVLVPLKRIEF